MRAVYRWRDVRPADERVEAGLHLQVRREVGLSVRQYCPLPELRRVRGWRLGA